MPAALLLGREVRDPGADPDAWARRLRERGYTAAMWPLDHAVDEAAERAWAEAARREGLLLGEVGVWSNPLHPDPATAAAKLERCRERLALADRRGIACCVNTAGSVGGSWFGPHPGDLTEETFARIVDAVRAIIDGVKPTRAWYTLETMPWMYPDSADSYRRLLAAVDRPRFGVHLDPANLVNCPARYADSGALIRECFAKLGPRVRSCHAKDVRMGDRLSVDIAQVAPGKGHLDYRTYLRCLGELAPAVPLFLEELAEEDYDDAAGFIRGVAGAGDR
jgi:sugar phosphate isomerase/epimerase